MKRHPYPIREQTIDGEKLRAARLKAGMTQEDLARAVDTYGSTVCRWENGHCSPPLVFLRRLARQFGVPLEDLLLE